MKKFWLDALIGTLWVFFILWSIYSISQLNLFNAFDPLGKALGDMEFTDIAFSQFREKEPAVDSNIVIVNIGYLPRGGIARQIANMNALGAKVIGLDIIFTCNNRSRDPVHCPEAFDTTNNHPFSRVAAQVPRLVLAEKLWQTKALVDSLGDVATYDSLENTDAELRKTPYEGFVNLETDAADQEDLKSCRKFNPRIPVNGKDHLAFAVKIAMLFDSVKTKKFLARNNFSEVINYRGNVVDWFGASTFSGRYMVLDVEQALDTTQFVKSMIKDKIVILGFMGADLRDTSWDDKFFTPLNQNYAGKSRPDMYGVVVHANIVSMILSGDAINEMADWQEYVLTFIIILLNVALFLVINEKLPEWFDGLSLAVQIVQVVILSLAMIYVFNWFNFKLNLTLTMAAVAIAGTCFELYASVVKETFELVKKKTFVGRLFT